MTELACLALAVYFEARTEPLAGQLAVAQVVLNRVEHAHFPDSICEVVEQGSPEGDALAARADCQFSWRCDGKPDKPYERIAWNVALAVARAALAGVRLPSVGEALYYHANYVSPGWARSLQRVASIGQHVFYTEPQQHASN